VGLAVAWSEWQSSLFIVKAATVIASHRQDFSPILDLEGAASQASRRCQPTFAN
jgi:hypothetical protein